jgi:hypothetical protein
MGLDDLILQTPSPKGEGVYGNAKIFSITRNQKHETSNRYFAITEYGKESSSALYK